MTDGSLEGLLLRRIQRNLDDLLDAFTGGGQTLELAFYPGLIETQFQLQYIHPFIFDSEYEFSFTGFRRLRFREAWDETRTGMIIGVGVAVVALAVLGRALRPVALRIFRLLGFRSK